MTGKQVRLHALIHRATGRRKAASCSNLIKSSLLYISQLRLLGVYDLMNTAKAPGKHWRKGLTLIQAAKFFDDPVKTEEWFVAMRWPDGVRCPFCDSPT